jgi:hypothetical protein
MIMPLLEQSVLYMDNLKIIIRHTGETPLLRRLWPGIMEVIWKDLAKGRNKGIVWMAHGTIGWKIGVENDEWES